AVMLTRLNTMLDGTAGASAGVAPFIAQMLNSGLAPRMPQIGSIGSSDLVAMASMAHAFIGEGQMIVGDAAIPAAEALAAAGCAVLQLQPKDGSVLCNNTAFSAGLSALAAHDALIALRSLQITGALSLAAFGGN